MVIYKEGIYRFLNGKELYIEEIEYSYNGIDKWEDDFEPLAHTNSKYPNETIPGHEYRRFRHAGDDYFQKAEYIVAKDGDIPVFRKNDTYIQVKLSLEADEAWQDLVALADIKGDKGDDGNRGEGWHVDSYGFLDTRPMCGNIEATVNNCDPCSGSVTQQVAESYIYLSIGNHLLVEADIGTGTNRWHIETGTTWVQSTTADIGKSVIAWAATAAANTNSNGLTCNYQGVVLLYTATPNYSSKGYGFVCAGGYWTQLMNVALHTGEVKLNAADNLEYVEDKLDNVTLYHDGDVISVQDDSIGYAKWTRTDFGNGLLDETVSDKIIVNVADFDGFGLQSYVSNADSFKDLQVYVDDLIDDGLQVHDDTVNVVDGETRHKIKINVDDILSTTSGLLSRLPTAGESTDLTNKDIFVKPYFGVSVTANGVSLVVNTAIFDLDIDGLDLKPDSITAVHINPDVVGSGLIQDINGQIDMNLEAATFGINGSNELYILDDAILGNHLNSDVVNETKGLIQLNNKIELKVNDDYFIFNSAGELTVTATMIDNMLTDKAVTSISAGGQILRNAITLSGNSLDTYVDITVVKGSGHNEIVISANTSESALSSLISSQIANLSGLDISDITGLQTALDAKLNIVDGVRLNTLYNNFKITQGEGAMIYDSSANAWYSLHVTTEGGVGYLTVNRE